MRRCPWVPLDKPLYVEYHDIEWGVPSRDPRHLFEMLCLEGAQAGLSWWTILQKRQRYREVFENFEPAKVAKMTDARLEKLVLDAGLIRHRGKILAVRQNARAWLEIDEPVDWLWGFAPAKPKRKRPETMADYTAKTPESDAMSKALKRPASSSSAPPLCMPSCRPPEWSMIIPRIASGWVERTGFPL